MNLAPGEGAYVESGSTRWKVVVARDGFNWLEAEVKSPDPPTSYLVLNYVAEPDGSLTLLANLSGPLDRFMTWVNQRHLYEFNKKLVEGWTLLARCLAAASRNDFSTEALTMLEDPEDGVSKWFAVRNVPNPEGLSHEDLPFTQASDQAARSLMLTALSLIIEARDEASRANAAVLADPDASRKLIRDMGNYTDPTTKLLGDLADGASILKDVLELVGKIA